MSFSALLYVAIACLSAYGLSHSARSIPKLKKYEDKAERAAKWSNTADKRLWDTRYTVGAGCVLVSCFLPLLTCLGTLASEVPYSRETEEAWREKGVYLLSRRLACIPKPGFVMLLT
jgi:hypothetical protein